MNHREADATLRALEESRDLLRHNLDGWSAWPLVRLHYGLAATGTPLPRSGIDQAGDWMGRLPSLVISDLRAYLGLPRARTVAIQNPAYQSERAGGYEDIYLDPLLRHLPDFVKLEHHSELRFRERALQAALPSRMSTTGLRVLSEIPTRLGLPRRARQVARALHLELKDLTWASFSQDYLFQKLARFSWRRRLYRRIFERIRAHRLLVVSAYTEQAAVAAARELGMRVYELQHGIVRRTHPGYNWGQYARRYKERIVRPDVIFTYGDLWTEELQAHGFWDREPISAGYLRMDRYRDRSWGPDPALARVVLTTQALAAEPVIAWAQRFLELGGEMQLIVKYHPSEIHQQLYVRGLADRRVRLVDAQEEPSTYELLGQADLHLSVSSSCHYDALGLGTPTGVLPFETSDMVEDLWNTPWSFLATSPEQALQALRDYRGKRVDSLTRDRYFRRGALETMLTELGT